MPYTDPHGYIVNGVVVKRFNYAPNDVHVLQGIVNYIIASQTVQLARQQTDDTAILSGAVLTAIPSARFHIGGGIDFNALACHIVPVTNYDNKSIKRNDVIQASMVITIENGADIYNLFTISKSYLTAFHAILDTIFKIKPQLFIDGWAGAKNADGSENKNLLPYIEGDVLKQDVVHTSQLGISEYFGWIPSLEFQIVSSPNIQQ